MRNRIVLLIGVGLSGAGLAVACAQAGTTEPVVVVEDAGKVAIDSSIPDVHKNPPADTFVPDAAMMMDAAFVCAPGTVDLNNNPSDGCEYMCTPTSNAPSDPIDPNFTDDNCDGSDGVVAQCVFVASDGQDVSTGGDRSAPVATIAYAQTLAKAQGRDVCLSTETYNGQINMVSGVSVYGGFDEKDPAFAFRRTGSSATSIAATGTVVYVPSIAAETHLEGLTLNAATSTGIVGASTYGVRAIGGAGTLYIRYNILNIAQGQNGGGGSNGSTGGAGNPGAQGTGACSNCSNIGFGSGGSPGGGSIASSCGGDTSGAGGQGGYDHGAGTTGGTTTVIGGTNGGGGSCATFSTNDGNNGGPGNTPPNPGGDGAKGGAGPAKGSISAAATYVPNYGGDGKPGSPGGSGSGGGGGGGGPSCTFADADRGAGGGSGGTGGCGGTQGTGGQGGGGSFGVLVYGGTVVVGHNSITTGKGGTGGPGGSGAYGGPGGTGAGGGGTADDGRAGGKGGDGSGGGKGGNGGGGGGGPSICIGYVSSVSLTQTPANTCTPGAGGGGGSGAATGQVGTNGALLTF